MVHIKIIIYIYIKSFYNIYYILLYTVFVSHSFRMQRSPGFIPAEPTKHHPRHETMSSIHQNISKSTKILTQTSQKKNIKSSPQKSSRTQGASGRALDVMSLRDLPSLLRWTAWVVKSSNGNTWNRIWSQKIEDLEKYS